MLTPQLYPVVIMNDDITTFEEIIQAVGFVFHLDACAAMEIADTIHRDGRVVIGHYIYEIAEAKVADIEKINELNGISIDIFIDDEDIQALDELTRKLGMSDDDSDVD